MGDTKEKEPKEKVEREKSLDPARFAYISDRTYSAAEVEEVTAVVQASTPACLRSGPNAKMFLRSFWYRSVVSGLLTQDEMHIYTVARRGPMDPAPQRPECLCEVLHALLLVRPFRAGFWDGTSLMLRALMAMNSPVFQA